MALAVLGVSHHTAPVDVRERFHFGPHEVHEALRRLRVEAGAREVVLLSTCNRTEIYLFPVEKPEDLVGIQDHLLEKAGFTPQDGEPYIYQLHGEGVVRHLFQVTSGLDSLVMGEAEIQGQVREAYLTAGEVPVEPALAGTVLHRLFQSALAAGGQVRAETQVGEGSASVASVAVELARKIFGRLKGRRVLILGAGATAELTVEALGREGVRGVVVANRTRDRAEALAARLGGTAAEFDELAALLPEIDIVVASTSAPHPVLTQQVVDDALKKGGSSPLLIVDIALPRDVESSVGDDPRVFLYNVDDLRKIVDAHVARRRTALPQARRIIQEHARQFRDWYATLEVVPVIRSLRARGEALRQEETEWLSRRLAHLPEEDRARVEEFSRRLMNKLLHDPTVRLRQGVAEGGGPELVRAVRFLFGLEEGEEMDVEAKDRGEPEAEGEPRDFVEESEKETHSVERG